MRGAHALQPLLLRTFFGSGAVIFNQDKVRLVSDPTVESLRRGESVLVQKTDYFASLCTNEMARREVRSRETGAHRYSGLEAMASNGFLLDLEQSYCSNHVGVGSLAFTSDGQLVLTIQARGSAQNPNLLVPSASGSADWGDLREGDHLPGFLVRAMERELAEECGLESMRPAPRVETRLLGFARLLMRGGKPEFFGVSYVDAPFADLSITRKESVYIADLLGSRVSRSRAEELTSSIDEFRRRHRHSPRHHRPDRARRPLPGRRCPCRHPIRLAPRRPPSATIPSTSRPAATLFAAGMGLVDSTSCAAGWGSTPGWRRGLR